VTDEPAVTSGTHRMPFPDLRRVRRVKIGDEQPHKSRTLALAERLAHAQIEEDDDGRTPE
jgi:hypothetical protein